MTSTAPIEGNSPRPMRHFLPRNKLLKGTKPAPTYSTGGPALGRGVGGVCDTHRKVVDQLQVQVAPRGSQGWPFGSAPNPHTCYTRFSVICFAGYRMFCIVLLF